MVFSVYYTENLFRSEELIEYFETHKLPRHKLYVAFLPRIFDRELPYFTGLKFPIIFSRILESLYDENDYENCQKIWQVIFMLIMRDEMLDTKINRRRLFERRVVAAEEEDEEEEEVQLFPYSYIFEYYVEREFDLEVGWSIFMHNLVESAMYFHEENDVRKYPKSKGVICKKCHAKHQKRMDPHDCVCTAGTYHLGKPYISLSIVSAAFFISHFSSLVSTNKRQVKHENTTNLLMMKVGKRNQLIHTVPKGDPQQGDI